MHIATIYIITEIKALNPFHPIDMNVLAASFEACLESFPYSVSSFPSYEPSKLPEDLNFSRTTGVIE